MKKQKIEIGQELKEQAPKQQKTRQQLGVFVDSALWRTFRATAIQRGETATVALERAMARELERFYGKQQDTKRS